MQKYRNILFIVLFAHISVYAIYSDYWHYEKEFVLKKDNYFSAKLTQDGISKDLHVKWTLYVNNLLTMQVNFDRFNHQFNLRLSNDESVFKLPLFRRKGLEMEQPYLMIKLLKYEHKNSQAKLKIFIRNPSGNIKVSRGNN